METPEQIAERLTQDYHTPGIHNRSECLICMLRSSFASALAVERERGGRKEEEARRHWERVQSLEERRKSADEIISDAIERFSYLFDVWRDSKSNEDIAEGLRNFLQEWPSTRERYCGAHSVLSVFQGGAADLARRLQEEQARAGLLQKTIERAHARLMASYTLEEATPLHEELLSLLRGVME